MSKPPLFSQEHLDSSILEATLMQAPMAMACVDSKGDVWASNQHFQDLIKASLQDLSYNVYSMFPTLDRVRWARLWQMLEDQGSLVTREVLGIDPNHGRTVELSLQLTRNENAQWVVMYLRDVEALQQAEGVQLLQHEVLEAVALGRPIRAVMELLCKRVEALAPEVTCTVLLVDTEGRVHPCAAPSMPAAFSEAIDGESIGPKAGSCGTAAWRGEAVEVTDIANDPLWEHYRELALPFGLAACWSSPIKLRDGRVAGTFALYYRESRGASAFHRQMVNACVHLCCLAVEHEETEQQIHRLAFYDPLTGLANRSLLQDRAQRALSRVATDRKPLTVMLLDLDRFKTVNDSLGHALGDRLLNTIASRLQHFLKPSDTLARLGGDEFVLLVSDSGQAQAAVLAEQLLKTITEPVVIDSTELSPTASIGISISPDDARDFETLQKNADVAMYQAKAAGRNTYRFFQAQMNDAAIKRLELESALRRAIVENELKVHYQPQINLKTQRLHGVEALIRWQHPQWGLVSPAVFIPLAEESGLIGAIDHFVLQEVCRQFMEWRRQGYDLHTVAVNLSVADFHYADVADRVQSLLRQYNMPPEALTLEITETVMLNAVDEPLEMMHKIRRMGVNLSVDDFGTGYSSLSYLKRFPVNELKLDQTFVRDLAGDSSDRALASAIIQLGEIFDLTVVAEGVETQEQLQILAEKHCTVVQGYLFARPMPADQLVSWLQGEGKKYLD